VYDAGTTDYDKLMARHLQVSHEGNSSRHTDRVDVTASYLVYNLFVAISGMPEASHLLRDIGVFRRPTKMRRCGAVGHAY
jgi:hypothetical protein